MEKRKLGRSALAPVRDEVVTATKFGFDIDARTGERSGNFKSYPEHILAVCDASLKRLRTDRIDLFYQHRVDQNVPIPGTRKLHRLDENLGAAAIELGPDELNEIVLTASRIEVHGARGTGHEQYL